MELELFGNPLRLWLIAIAIALSVLVGLVLVRYALRKKLSGAQVTPTDVDDFLLSLVGRTKLLLLVFPTGFFAVRVLDLPEKVTEITQAAAVLAFLVQLGLWLSGFVEYWLGRQRRLRLQEDPAAVTTMVAFGFVLKLFLWSVVFLLALDNLGIDVTALVAGLGIGGIAVALATQNILGDLFASLSIIIDKPFVIGDVIHVGDYIGMVEHVGLKTTRIRSLSGEQLIFSNGDLIQSRIRNYRRMMERRVLFHFGVVYKTPSEKLEKIPRIVREAIDRQSCTRFDRAHFHKFGDSSLDFEVVYYVLDPDYTAMMDIQQAINLVLVRSFEAEGIEFAYPTRTLYVQSSDVLETPQEMRDRSFARPSGR